MRNQFCQVDTKEEAKSECPWACEVVEVEGGWMCFESVKDYETWANQS